MQNIPKEVPNRTSFHAAWNAILKILRTSRLRSSPDIVVSTDDNGTTLTLAPGAKGGGMKYDTDSIRQPKEGESYATLQSRVSTFLTSYLTDAPVWNANTALNGFKVGQIVRVLPYFDEDGDPTYSQVDLTSSFDATFSGSNITGSIWNGALISQPGTYICVCDIPASSSYPYASASAAGAPYAARNPKICYSPLWPEPKVNAAYFGTAVSSGSLFEAYQGRYWECIGLFNPPATSSGGMSFKGTWASNQLYSVQDMVRLEATSSNGGTYVCVVSLTGSQSGSSYQPSVGSPYWVQIATSDTRGSWY